jgi:hypothetical protein
MIRPRLLVVIALSALACSPSSADDTDEDDAAEQSELRSGTALFTTGEVRLRAEPKITSDALVILPRNTAVTLAASALRDRFRQVSLPSGTKGWIFMGHLALRAPSESASELGDRAGTTFTADGSGYYPANTRMEGGFKDVHGVPLNTLQQFLAGERPYVSVAMDSQAFAYGQKLQIKELEQKYERPIEFRVVDTGGAFKNRGRDRMDICVANERASYDQTINGDLTVTLVD